MKSNTGENAEEKIHQSKGKFNEAVGNDNPAGRVKYENLDEKIREDLGRIKKVIEAVKWSLLKSLEAEEKF